MDIKWEDIKLGEILELITDYHSNGSYETLKKNVELLDKKDFAIMIRTTNFEQNSFSENLKYISEHSYSFLKKSMVYHGDIIMNKIANAGSVYFMPNLNHPVSLAMNLFLLRINKEKANQHFVFYYLKANESYVKQFAEGSVTKTITKNAVRNLIVRMPSIEIQDKIVTIIESLESKIDNLRRQNETLETIAKTLFKHWFIDFEFPNADGKPYKSSSGGMWRSAIGDIPEGWKFSRIDDEVETVGGGTPSTTELGYWENGDIAWYSPTDLTRSKTLFSIDSEKKITSLGLQKSSARLFPKYSLLLTSRATIGEVTISTKDACTNQGFITIIPNERFSVYFLYGWLLTKIGEIKQLASGSTFPEISKTIFRGLDFLIPVNDILEKYEKLIKPIYKKIEINIFQIQTLTKTRDALLPKLMSGQLRVKE